MRSLLRQPGYAAAAILCLTLGIGGATAVFSAIDAAILKPLPFREPGALVTIYRTTPNFNNGPFSPPNYLDLNTNNVALAGIAALTTTSSLVLVRDEAVRVSSVRITGNAFDMLGVRALPGLGRTLTPGDEERSAGNVMLLSEEFWRERFGADSAALGQRIQVNGVAHEVVGIVPARLRIPHGARRITASVWVPMRFSESEQAGRRSNFLMLFGRLGRGATVAAADAELRTRMDGLTESYPELRGEQLRVESMQSESAGGVRTQLLVIAVAVALVLLIAVANVSSLLLARGIQLSRDTAIRNALGASRWEVVRPLLMESLLISGVGAVSGLGLAWLAIHAIRSLAAAQLPQLVGLGFDIRVTTFAIGLSLATGLLCSILPSLRAGRAHAREALAQGERNVASRAQRRLLNALVGAEVALSFALLVGASLALRGFWNLTARDPGFDVESMLTLEATVSPDRYADRSTVETFLMPALDAVNAVPGVARAATINLVPYVNWGWNFNISYEGRPADDPTRLPLVERRVVSPGFFATTGQHVVAGRLLSELDVADSDPVAVANEALVARDFAGGDVLGQRFTAGGGTPITIVGVVSNIRNFGPFQDPRPEVYISERQAGSGGSTFSLLVRAEDGALERITGPVQEALRSVDPQIAISRVRPLSQVMSNSMGGPRFYLILLGAFSAMALLLAIAGLFGVVSYSVAQRTRELALRAALGAGPAQLRSQLLREALVVIAGGLAAGAVASLLLGRLLESLLFGVSRGDALAWTAAPLLLVASALAAVLLAARKATRISPRTALG